MFIVLYRWCQLPDSNIMVFDNFSVIDTVSDRLAEGLNCPTLRTSYVEVITRLVYFCLLQSLRILIFSSLAKCQVYTFKYPIINQCTTYHLSYSCLYLRPPLRSYIWTMFCPLVHIYEPCSRNNMEAWNQLFWVKLLYFDVETHDYLVHRVRRHGEEIVQYPHESSALKDEECKDC
jgi:hypothetical protein